MLLSRLTQTSIAQLQLGLCRRILDSPLKHLEEIGTHRMLASLTGDVGVVSQAMNGVPVLGVNVVILICGAVYLGSLSPSLLLGAVCLLLARHGQLLVLRRLGASGTSTGRAKRRTCCSSTFRN